MWGFHWDGNTGFPDHPKCLEGPNTYNLVRLLPNIKRLNVYGFYYPFREAQLRTLNLLSQLARLKSSEMSDVVFDVEELLAFLSPMVHLKQLIISFLFLDYLVDYARGAVICMIQSIVSPKCYNRSMSLSTIPA